MGVLGRLSARFATFQALLGELTPYHGLVFAGCWLGGVFDGMDSTLMAVVLPAAIGDLAHTNDGAVIGRLGSWVVASFLIGWTLGGIVMGMIGDRLGRVTSMILSVLCYALFTGLSGFAQSWEQLALFRFLTGLGIGGELVAITTFLTEVWPQRSRPLAVGALLTSYMSGVFLAGVVHYGFPNWRVTFWVGALPALLVFLLRRGLKESERWEDSLNHEADHAAAQPAATGLASYLGLLGALWQPGNRRNLICAILVFGGLLVGYWASVSWVPTWLDTLRLETLKAAGSALADAGTTAAGHLRSQASMIQGLAAVGGTLSSGFLCEWLGRRNALSFGFLGGFIFSGFLFLTHSSITPGLFWQLGAMSYFVGVVQGACYVYIPELFPTRIRATGVGVSLNAARSVTAVAVLFLGTVVSLLNGYGPAAFVFSLSYIAGALALWLGDETKGKALR